jgi:UDP-N-acetylglucosamine diphosphorylase / glucose-1-phosphate thymidylyltransferase / UDP-N-acetylgalactosamine diphosphorylase / glucosamine-1-phosphate N-acetyltransferase / galactosamine-1-phosphate N-acetyltransferase
MQFLVFEDDLVSRLYPITIGRPAYAITCASYRLIDWVGMLALELGARAYGVVRPHLAEHQRLDYPPIAGGAVGQRDGTLLVSARLVPSAQAAQTLRQLAREARPGVVMAGESLAAAWIDADGSLPLHFSDPDRLAEYVKTSIIGKLAPLDGISLPLLDYPHDVVRQNLAVFEQNLAHRIRTGEYRETADGVFAAEGATLGQYTVTDTKTGPIVLEAGASVGSHCLLRGPAWLGPKSRVIEHSAIKDMVSLGHTTKIGGEVEASIIEPFTNKQHHGFLGHSYLGSWINLGAGTCNSDLKNTYGTVKMEYRGQQVSTGMQFVGCIIGDYAKTAINTGIFTGKTVGCCSMVYGFVTTNVPSFVNYARLFGQVTELPVDVMVASQQRMFARRNVEQRPCDIELLQAMHELTRNERQLAGEPLSL